MEDSEKRRYSPKPIRNVINITDPKTIKWLFSEHKVSKKEERENIEAIKSTAVCWGF